MPNFSAIPVWQFLDANGDPYAGGLLYTFEAGGPTTPKTAYDKDNVALTNPVVFDSAGKATIKLGTGKYYMVFTDGTGATLFDPSSIEGTIVWAIDNIEATDTGVLTVTVVDDVIALRAINEADISDGQAVLVRGYATADDGGGGLFSYDAASTSTDDSGMVIAPTDSTGQGRWIRQYYGGINPRWFGAVADGNNDDTDAVIAAKDFAELTGGAIELDRGIFNLTSDPDISGVQTVLNAAAIKWSGFALDIDPVIAISSTSRHFYYTPGSDTPVFPEDEGGKYAEIKNAWLDGVTPGWYQSSLRNEYVADVLALDARVTVNEGNISNLLLFQTDAETAIGTLQSDVSNLQTQVSGIEAGSAGVTETGAFVLTTKSTSTTPTKSTCCRYKITHTGETLTFESPNDTWTEGTVSITVNSTSYPQAYDSVSRDTSLTALAALVEADDNVASCVYDSVYGTIHVLFNAGLEPNISSDVSLRVGTLTFAQRADKTVTLSGTRISGCSNYVGTGANGKFEFEQAVPATIRPGATTYCGITITRRVLLTPTFGKGPGCLVIDTSGYVSVWAPYQDVFYNTYCANNSIYGGTGERGVEAFTVSYPLISD